MSSASKDWRFSVDRQGIAWAVFDREGESQNSLGRRPLEELGAIVERVEAGARSKEVAGLVFMLGQGEGLHRRRRRARVRAVPNGRRRSKPASGPFWACSIASRRCRFPVVCCIHGFCLGGGLELALACHWRIATRDDGTRLGFPEVRLGLFPGFNGTWRSIRQAGAMSAMEIMLTGRMVRASAARAMGLVDELAPGPHNLAWMARKAVERKRKSRPMGGWRALAEALADSLRCFAGKLRSETAKKARKEHYPAPFALIDLFERTGGDLARMKAEETPAFAP